MTRPDTAPDADLVGPDLPARLPFPPAAAVDPLTEQRAIGAVVGSAVGDALGARFEFGSAGAYRREFPTPVVGGIGEMVGGGPFPWEPGEFTDDTQMALALAESVLAQGGFDADDVWARFRAWAATATDVGILTRRALAHPSWPGTAEAAHVASNGLSAANGALMRVTGLAVAFALRPSPDAGLLTRAARAQAALTHHDPAAGWGAALGAELVAVGLRGGDPLAELDRLLAGVDPDVVGRFAEVLDPAWSPTAAFDPWAGSGTVWGCLGRAVWALRRSDTFAEAVVAAIDLGGDTDTVAAVTGAIAGAIYGIQCIPSRWTTYVHGRLGTPAGEATYDNQALQILARRLVGKEPGPKAAPEPAAGPVRVAPRLHAADLVGATAMPDDAAVVSLCRTGGAFDHHPVRREVFLVDQGGGANGDLAAVVADAVASIDAFLTEGREVVVHCHGGRSRTGLVLKAWAMRANGWSEPQAHQWLAERWLRYDPYQRSFVDFLEREWPAAG